MKLFLVAMAAMLLPAAAQADTYAETTDVGQTLATAAKLATGNGASLTAIRGTLGANDADLFQIYIANPASFSATTNNAATNNGYLYGGALDTALFLFDSTGRALATNDDADGFNITSTLPRGNALYAGLAAGTYYLGISSSGNEAVNSVNQLLFARSTNGSTTQVRGTATGLNPTTLATFNGNASDDTPGTYQIDLTGASFGPAVTAAVPEPAAWTLTIAGLGLAGGALRRRPRTSRRASMIRRPRAA